MHDSLLLNGLRALVHRHSAYVHIPGYFDPQGYDAVLPTLRARETRATSSIYRTDGISLFDAIRTPSLFQEYLDESPLYSSNLRRLFKPLLSPVDEFRLFLEDYWFAGSSLLPFGHKQARFGLVRIWQPGSEARPHQDVLRRECPSLPIAKEIRVQLGFNAYLSQAGTGGTLKIWDRCLADNEASGFDGSYGLEACVASTSATSIAPAAGDLVLLNTEYIHAVSRIDTGCRITLSGFVGYVDDNHPLYLWS